MAQVAINDMNPEIVQAYLKMSAIGQQRTGQAHIN